MTDTTAGAPRPTLTINSVVITVEGRPWTLNGERRGTRHWTITREETRTWRRKWELAALNRARGVRFNRVVIDVESWQHHPLPDTGNIYPAVKAAIDGIVDARIIPGDGPRQVVALTIHAAQPIPTRERERVTITIRSAR